MNHCVPDWDASSFLDDLLSPAAKQQVSQPRGLDGGFVPGDDFQELCWEHGKLVVVTHDQVKGPRPHEFRPCKPESRVIKHMPKHSPDAAFNTGPLAPRRDETLEAVVGGAGRTQMCPLPEVCDDEMLAWLHYPSNCSIESNSFELQSGYPNAAAILSKDSGGQTQTGVHRTSLLALTKKSKDHRNDNLQQNYPVLPHNPHTIEDLMSASTWMGYSKLESNHTPKQSRVSVSKSFVGNVSSITSASISNGSEGVNQDFAVTSDIPFSKMLPTFPDSCSVYSHPLQFSPFSGPSAAVKANLNHVGITAGLSALEKVNQIERVEVNSCSDVLIESCVTGRGPCRSIKGEGEFLFPASTHSNRSLGSRRVADPGVNGNKPVCTKHVSVDRGLYNGSHQPGEDLDTSWSDGSGSRAANGSRVVCVRPKRKAGEVEGSECQSQDVVNAEQRPPVLQSDLRPRSRAVEGHNLSEKRRRERINEKLKELQELVPNANKTDKASVLDEAIEYMKTLQAQIQVMSNMYGMGFSSIAVPAHGMQYAHVLPQQMGVALENTSGLASTDMAATCVGLPYPGWGMPMTNVQYLPTSITAIQPSFQSPPIIYGGTQFSHAPSTASSLAKELHVQNPSGTTGNSIRQQVHQLAQPVIRQFFERE